jgi:hypothetical protein
MTKMTVQLEGLPTTKQNTQSSHKLTNPQSNNLTYQQIYDEVDYLVAVDRSGQCWHLY